MSFHFWDKNFRFFKFVEITQLPSSKSPLHNLYFINANTLYTVMKMTIKIMIVTTILIIIIIIIIIIIRDFEAEFWKQNLTS